jgi:hypothetical protein
MRGVHEKGEPFPARPLVLAVLADVSRLFARKKIKEGSSESVMCF